MIICSCAVISDRDIELAVAEIMSSGPGLLPTPGVVFRHLKKKMNCCSCAPVAVSAIYAAMERLAKDTRISPYALAEARADAFTVGSAVFDGSFAPHVGSLRSQLKAVLDACS